MPATIPTPPLSGGFVENLNIVAKQIRETNDSIFDDMNEYIDLSRRWANEAHLVEPDPINYPGEYSSYSHSIDSLAQAVAAAASAAAALVSENAAADILVLCEAELALCQAEVINCQAEVVKCQDEVALATAQAVLSQTSADDSEVSNLASGVSANDSQLYAWESEAEQKTSDSYANEYPGNVIEYSSNGDGTFTEVITTNFSSVYWANEARLSSSGFSYQGQWDVVDCSMPPVPTPIPGESADGSMYVVRSVTGDSTGCSGVAVGDWLVWYGDDAGTDGTVEGQWGVVNWTFDWSAITNVPENVYNALSRSGGRMTGDIEFINNNKIVMSTAGGTFYNIFYVDGSNVMQIGTSTIPVTANGDWTFINVSMTTASVSTLPSANNDVANKIYVDTHPIDGGTY